MALGDITSQLATLGKALVDEDPAAVENAKLAVASKMLVNEPLASVPQVITKSQDQIGYLAGYLPAEVGNRVLQFFKIRHPIFGDRIPDDIDVAYEAGKKMSREWMAEIEAREQRQRKIETAAKLGVTIPMGAETVSSADAARLLNRLRAARAAAGDPVAKRELEEIEAKAKAKLEAAVEAATLADILGIKALELESVTICAACDEPEPDCVCYQEEFDDHPEPIKPEPAPTPAPIKRYEPVIAPDGDLW